MADIQVPRLVRSILLYSPSPRSGGRPFSRLFLAFAVFLWLWGWALPVSPDTISAEELGDPIGDQKKSEVATSPQGVARKSRVSGRVFGKFKGAAPFFVKEDLVVEPEAQEGYGPLDGVEVLVEGKAIRSQQGSWGPVEIETSLEAPAVSAKYERYNRTWIPTAVRVEQIRPGEFDVTILFDFSEWPGTTWRVSGQVVGEASGLPIPGATVTLRDTVLTTPATGVFGPIDVPADVEAVAVSVSGTRHGRAYGIISGARRNFENRVFMLIQVDLGEPSEARGAPPASPTRPTLSYGDITLTPPKVVYDVGDEVRLTVTYQLDGVAENEKVVIEKKFRVKQDGGSVQFPTDGSWVLARSERGPGVGSYMASVILTPDFPPGRYVIEILLEGQGLDAVPIQMVGFSVSDIYAKLAQGLQAGIGLLEQCKPVVAADRFKKVVSESGSRDQTAYTDLHGQAQAALTKAQAAAGQMEDALYKLRVAESSLPCDAPSCSRALDAIQVTALPPACAAPVRTKMAALRAQAQERLGIVSAMSERLSRGEANIQACQFEAASVALRDPVFATNRGCPNEKALAANAKIWASASDRLKTLVYSFQQTLRDARIALAEGRRVDAERAANRILRALDQLPNPDCFKAEESTARTILAQARGGVGQVPPWLKSERVPSPIRTGPLHPLERAREQLMDKEAEKD